MEATKDPPLRAVRQARGMSLRFVAAQADISPAQLSRAERGLGRLSVPALRRVAGVLGLKELASMLEPYERRNGS